MTPCPSYEKQKLLLKGGVFRWSLDFSIRHLHQEYELLHSGKLTLQWKIPTFNREYIFKRPIFHCHVSLPEGIGTDQ